MKIGLFVSEPERWEPRRRIAISETITPVEREILDVCDVLEQKSDFNNIVAIRAYWLALILLAITIITNGTAALKVVQGWIGASETASSISHK